MKVVMKEIEMIAWFAKDGTVHPIRYRILGPDGSNISIKINRIIYRKEEKLAGNKMVVFACQSIFDSGVEKRYELKYEIGTCKWYLYKI